LTLITSLNWVASLTLMNNSIASLTNPFNYALLTWLHTLPFYIQVANSTSWSMVQMLIQKHNHYLHIKVQLLEDNKCLFIQLCACCSYNQLIVDLKATFIKTQLFPKEDLEWGLIRFELFIPYSYHFTHESLPNSILCIF
jgi:hypothetical protein